MKCNYCYIKILYCKNNMSCPVKVNSNTIELKVHTSCYCVLDLQGVTSFFMIHHLTSYFVDLVEFKDFESD